MTFRMLLEDSQSAAKSTNHTLTFKNREFCLVLTLSVESDNMKEISYLKERRLLLTISDTMSLIYKQI